jgi:cytochrome P450
MRALSAEFIDAIVAAGRCDFLAGFAVPYPSLIFVPLMGLPESDLDTFLGWKNKILHTTDEAQRAEVFRTVNAELQAYFTGVFRERRGRATQATT